MQILAKYREIDFLYFLLYLSDHRGIEQEINTRETTACSQTHGD